MRHPSEIDVTFRGVHPNDTTIDEIRRSYREMLRVTGEPLRSLRVLVERTPRDARVRTYLMYGDGPDAVRARARHADERVAAHLALEDLGRRLGGFPRPQVLRRERPVDALPACRRAS